MRAVAKLISWKARGGYYRHISWVVGLIPIPRRFLTGGRHVTPELKALAELGELMVTNVQEGRSHEKAKNRIEELVQKMYGLSSSEANIITEYGDWLNELSEDYRESKTSDDDLEEDLDSLHGEIYGLLGLRNQ